jgi:hypothetical protein
VLNHFPNLLNSARRVWTCSTRITSWQQATSVFPAEVNLRAPITVLGIIVCTRRRPQKKVGFVWHQLEATFPNVLRSFVHQGQVQTCLMRHIYVTNAAGGDVDSSVSSYFKQRKPRHSLYVSLFATEQGGPAGTSRPFQWCDIIANRPKSNGFVSNSKFGTFEPLAARVSRPTACELTPTIRTRQTSACSGKASPKFFELWVPDCKTRHGSAFGANGTRIHRHTMMLRGHISNRVSLVSGSNRPACR